MRRSILAFLLVAGCAPSAKFLVRANSFPSDREPTHPQLADFDGDGKLDLLVGSTWSRNELRLHRGLGDGRFERTSTLIGSFANSRAGIVDLNGDGKLDLLLINFDDEGTLSVLLGRGDLTFNAATHYVVGGAPGWAWTADFDNDGKIDVIIANHKPDSNAAYSDMHGNLTVLPGRGDGTFGAARTQDVVGYVEAITVGDWNGDKKIDVAMIVELSQGRQLRTLRGRGDGYFDETARAWLPFGGRSLRAVDIDKNGTQDLIVGHAGFSVLLGDGQGTFRVAGDFRALPHDGLTVGDLNADGKLDVATAREVFVGDGTGHFFPPKSLGEPYAWGKCTTGDVDGDGAEDLVVADAAHNTVRVYKNVARPAGTVPLTPY